MPSFSDYDSAVTYAFGLTIDGITTKSIMEVDGLVLEADAIEMRENTPDGKYVIRKVPGRKKAGELVFTRLFQQDDSWAKWIDKIFKGDVTSSRKNGTVDVYDYQGKKVASFKFLNGWPSRIEYTGLRAGDANPMTERMTITHEGLESQAS